MHPHRAIVEELFQEQQEQEAGETHACQAVLARGRDEADEGATEIAKAMSAVGLNVRVLLGSILLSIQELSALKAGDIVRLDVGLFSLGILEVEGVPKYSVEVVVSGRKRAVLVVSDASSVKVQPDNHTVNVVEPNNGIDIPRDVNLQVNVELGRTRLQTREILQLGPGSIVELDQEAGDAVDILANDQPIAKGEAIIIDEHFGVRLTSITSVADRIPSVEGRLT